MPSPCRHVTMWHLYLLYCITPTRVRFIYIFLNRVLIPVCMLTHRHPGPDHPWGWWGWTPGTTKIYKVWPLWVKKEIRTTMSDECLNALCLMAIESNLVRSLDFETVINRLQPSRRVKRRCKPNSSVCWSGCSVIGSCFTACALKPHCIVLAPC